MRRHYPLIEFTPNDYLTDRTLGLLRAWLEAQDVRDALTETGYPTWQGTAYNTGRVHPLP